MSIEAPNKDPDATLDYSLDWTPWLAYGETIASHTVTAAAGITKVSDSETDGKINFRLSGGTVGVEYEITVEVTTSSGQIDQRTVTVLVAER